MKIAIVYASWFGNGKKLVERLSGLLAERQHEVSVTSIMEDPAGTVPDAELYVFSSPTRKFSLPANVKSFVSAFAPPRSGARYALMTTFMDPRTIGLRKMQAILDSKGMQKIAEDCRIRSRGLRGPLEEGHEQKLAAFADEIARA